MRLTRLALRAAGFIASIGLFAQSAPQQPATFRATVRLIVQPVSVKDKQGKPVLGLTARDFVLTEDGQPQEIAFVEYQAFDAAPAATLSVGPPSAAAMSTPVPSATKEMPSVPIPGDVKYRSRR